MTKLIRRLPSLNVGCGTQPRKENVINCDLYSATNVDVVFDACKPWPFQDNSIGSIYASHVLEHLPDPMAFFREAWRVIAPSPLCSLQIRVPYGASNDGFGDLTHIRYYTPGSFCCVQPGYGGDVYNLQYNERTKPPFSVMTLYVRINANLRWLLKPIIRRWGFRMIHFLWNGFVELIVGLRPLKNPDEVKTWRSLYKGNDIPIGYCMHQHEYEGRMPRPNERLRLLFFGPGAKELQRLNDSGFAG